MARSGLLLACLLVAVVALCGAYHSDERHDDHEAYGRPSRYRHRDISAYELIDFIRSHGGGRDHHDDSSEEEHEEEHAEEEDHHGDEDDHEEEEHHDEHVWRFHIGHENFAAYNYLDHDGHAKGFFIDLIDAVCKEAHKECTHLIDDYEHCWRGHEGVEYPGVGLLGGWYDGCIGLSPTPDRQNAFDFTTSFTPTGHGALYYRAGDHGEDLLNIQGKNIGFADGWASGERCLNRQYGVIGNHEDEYIGHHYKNPKVLVKALLNKEVDVIITTAVLDEEKLGVVSAPRKFTCTAGGLSIMTQQHSGLIHWWDEAFQHFRESGRFATLCANSARKHADHGHLHCLH